VKKAIASAVMFLSTVAIADDIWLGKPGYGGSGCPGGTADAILSPDQKSLSILFDQFQTEAGYPSRKTLDRKNCDIAIPVHIPQGYSVALFDVDYRGYNSLPHGATSRLSVEYFFAGRRGPTFVRDFSGYLDQGYLVSNLLDTESMVWSPCGQDVILRVNASLVTRTNTRREQTLSTVDSTDVAAGLVYHLQWRRCR